MTQTEPVQRLSMCCRTKVASTPTTQTAVGLEDGVSVVSFCAAQEPESRRAERAQRRAALRVSIVVTFRACVARCTTTVGP